MKIMIHIIYLTVTIATILSFPAFASNQTQPSPTFNSETEQSKAPIKDLDESIPYTIEPRFSYQWFESSTIRDIYGSTVDYQLTGTIPVYQKENFYLRGVNVWWAVDYCKASGKSIGLKDKTNIQIEPITAGLKWIYPKSIFRPYLGIAFKYFFTQVYSDSSYVQKHINTSGPGFVTETGFFIYLHKYVFIDIFAAYSWKTFSKPSSKLQNVTTTSLDIGGINTGAGIGVKF